ncbi:hypothetical protein CQA18_27070, partial [Enterobacter hormaechei]
MVKCEMGLCHWLTTLGSYMFVTLKFDGASIGAVYSSLGIAAVF